MESVRTTPPPLQQEDHNAWADWWRGVVGVNVIPADTKNKCTFIKWSQWQLKPIPQKQHDEWKAENAFASGLAIIVGKVWFGAHAGKYLIFLDCDNQKAIEEISTRNDGATVPFEEITKKFLVEQHLDNSKNKAHIFFYSSIPFVKKGHDEGDENTPAIEVKGEGIHGIAYCTPSYHKNGHRYEIIGTAIPETLNEETAHQMMQHIDEICKKYGVRYLELNNNNENGNNALVPITELFKEDYRVYEKHNRHEALLRAMESLIKRNAGIFTLKKIKTLAHEWNQIHCVPPLNDKEFERQWKDATKFIIPTLLVEPAAAAAVPQQQQADDDDEQQSEQEPKIVELTPELTRELTYKEIAVILSTSIKKDYAPKIITFSAMLLAQTNEDQLTLGFQSESSAGKSYIPLEVCLYFPKNEVDEIASASPTAFYHDSVNSTWDAEKKLITCNLENKILIFMDMQHFQLMEKLRPMLSHDRKELKYKITDKSAKHGIKTKNVIIRGFPTVCFCSTSVSPDEQERTRMILLSPSIDQEKLKETLLLLALRKSNPAEYKRRMESDPKRVWLMNRIYAIRQGSIREIIVPGDGKAVYDRFIKEHEHLQARHQRDLPRLFSFIKAHALLNCFTREKPQPDTIIANDTDIEAGFALYKQIEQANELGLSPYLLGIYVDVIKPLLENSYYKEDGDGINNKDIMRKYYTVRRKPIGPRKLKDILEQLETVGLIRLDIDKEGDKRQKLVYATALSKITNDDDDGSGDGCKQKEEEGKQQ